jgi:hypothetical protein
MHEVWGWALLVCAAATGLLAVLGASPDGAARHLSENRVPSCDCPEGGEGDPLRSPRTDILSGMAAHAMQPGFRRISSCLFPVVDF